jgi:hypothetical protein
MKKAPALAIDPTLLPDRGAALRVGVIGLMDFKKKNAGIK